MSLKFELLCIDEQDKVKFKKPTNFVRSLSTIESLWKGEPSILEESLQINDDSQKISIYVKPFDTSKMVTGERFSSAYYIIVEGEYHCVEPFRAKLLDQLKDLGFSYRQILIDEVSNKIAIETYPLLNSIENLLRKYIVKFFITKIGTDWWSIAVSSDTRKNVQTKISNEIVFTRSYRVVANVTLLNFDQLGKIIYSQSSIFTKTEDIFEKIKTAKDLESLKQELLYGNYVKYFKDTFEQNEFEEKWKKLTFIRNKVAHSNYFTKEDLDSAKELHDQLVQIINAADSGIDQLTLSIADKEAVIKALDDLAEMEKEENPTEQYDEKNNEEIGETNLPEVKTIKSRPEHYLSSISEAELLSQLDKCSKTMEFVGLGYFVRNHLGNKGYSFNSSYALINLLQDKGKIELYEVPNPYGQFDTTAIRLVKATPTDEAI
ncbi:hypothetical protein NIES204_20930 [Planktothrix agardhii NIES-204]|jgi:hypothetical protein|nr:hypothetical protein NIES204_20930 [Planktothrix agardhii NIES-204]